MTVGWWDVPAFHPISLMKDWGRADCARPQSFLLPNKATFHILRAMKMAAPATAECQESEFSASAELSSSFAKSKKPTACTRIVKTKPKQTAAGLSVLGVFSDNLVHPLSAQAERVGNLGQGLSSKTSLSDVLVSVLFSGRPGTQRSPLPTGEHLQRTHPLRRKLSPTFPLAGVVCPIAKSEPFLIQNFHMDCRDFDVSFSQSELVERPNVQKESLIVIHNVYNSGRNLVKQPEFLATVVESNV